MEAILLLNSESLTVVKERPFLSYVFEYWINQGIERFIIPITPEQLNIKEYYGKQFRGIELDYLILKKDFGSGGNTLFAIQRALDQKILLIDTYYLGKLDLKLFKKFHRIKKSSFTYSKNSNLPAGVYLLEKNSLKAIPFERGDVFSIEEYLIPELMKEGNQVKEYTIENPLPPMQLEEMALSLSLKAA